MPADAEISLMVAVFVVMFFGGIGAGGIHLSRQTDARILQGIGAIFGTIGLILAGVTALATIAQFTIAYYGVIGR